MNLTKSNICVLIENEEQLAQAREILERCGEEIDNEYFNNEAKYAHLFSDGTWCTSSLTVMQGLVKKIIPLTELESVIKNSK